MHKTTRVRKFLTQPASLIRALLLCLLLLGSQFSVFAGFFAVAHAAGYSHGRGMVHSVVMPHMSSTKPHAFRGSKRRHDVGPDLNVSLFQSPAALTIGQPATFTAAVANGSSASPALIAPVATITLPTGFTNISGSAIGGWSFTTSGLVTVATYTGPLPIAAGQTLPAIVITATASANVINSQSVLVSVAAAGDVNTNDNSASVEVSVAGQPVATVGTTPVATVGTTPVATAEATPVATTGTAPIAVTGTTPVATTGTAPVTTTGTMPTDAKPTLFITKSHIGGSDTFQVGQTVTYALTVSNLPGSASENNKVTVFDLVPVGLTNVTSSATSAWSVTATNTTSPASILATYNGTYPIAAGTVLPAITLSGVLTSAAVPSLTNTAVVNSADAPSSAFNSSYDTISVLPNNAGDTTPVAGTAPIVAITPVAGTAPAPGTGVGGPVLTYPDLQVINSSMNGDHYGIGDDVTYFIAVTDLSTAGQVLDPTTISVEDVIPVGLRHIKVSGSQWNFTVSDKNSPTIIDATYSGTDPLLPGSTLPIITVKGELTHAAGPALTSTTTVAVANDSNTANNTASYTVEVKQDHDKDQKDQKDHNDHNDQDVLATALNNLSNSISNINNNNNNINNNNININNRNSANSRSSSSSISRSSISPRLPLTGSDPNAVR